MKRTIILVILAALLAIGSAVAVAATTGGNQGVPSAKTSIGSGDVDYDPTPGLWHDVPGLSAVIKTSSVSDLVISVTAESALATDVKISGTGKTETSTSVAQMKIRAIVDDNAAAPAGPGDVVFNSRLMQLKGLLWSGSDVGLLDLPTQFIQIYEETRSANAFNFLLPNVGVGVHTVKIQIMTDKSAGFEGGNAGAVIGKRTLVIEAVRLTN